VKEKKKKVKEEKDEKDREKLLFSKQKKSSVEQSFFCPWTPPFIALFKFKRSTRRVINLFSVYPTPLFS
jgi:hypothetical protein